MWRDLQVRRVVQDWHHHQAATEPVASESVRRMLLLSAKPVLAFSSPTAQQTQGLGSQRAAIARDTWTVERRVAPPGSVTVYTHTRGVLLSTVVTALQRPSLEAPLPHLEARFHARPLCLSAHLCSHGRQPI